MGNGEDLIGPGGSPAPRSFRCLSHIGPRVGDKAITVRHLDQWQGLRVHDLLLADDAVEVEEIGGHRVCLVGREGSGLSNGCARRI